MADVSRLIRITLPTSEALELNQALLKQYPPDEGVVETPERRFLRVILLRAIEDPIRMYRAASKAAEVNLNVDASVEDEP